MARVHIDTPERMSLLGLILGSLLERNTASGSNAALAQRMRGTVAVRSGEMVVAVTFAEDGITISRELPERVSARLEGALDVLTDLALARNLFRHALHVKVRGNLLLLLRIWRLMRVPASPALSDPSHEQRAEQAEQPPTDGKQA